MIDALRGSIFGAAALAFLCDLGDGESSGLET